ncbi:MAG: glycosyltransferase family 4 protein [Promethearchaeota archaeon]|jgi:glycosyltransferase involved in cell wall biosynthesis
MKICIATPYPLTDVGGIGRFVEDLYSCLENQKFDVVIISPTRRSEETQKLKTDFKDKIITIDVSKAQRPFKNLYMSFKMSLLIIKLRKQIQILHVQTPKPQSAFACILGRLLKIPTVTTLHGIFPKASNAYKGLYYRFFDWITIKFSNEVIAVSKETQEHYNSSSNKLISNGVNIEKYKPSENLRDKTRFDLGLKDEIVLMYVGRISFDKGIYELLGAVKKISKNRQIKIKLCLVGSILSDEETKLNAKIRELGIKDKIIFCGQQDNVVPYYCAADIFVLPSYHEGLPLALLEAMSTCLPVVVSNIGGMAEIVKEKINGLFVMPKDTVSLTEKINWCLDNPMELRTIGENARSTVIKDYSLKQMCEKYKKTYDNLIV